MARENLIAIVLLACVWQVSATCGTCNSTVNFKCTTYNKYQFCNQSGIAVGSVYDCPTNLWCNTAGSAICSTAIPECTCGVCTQQPTATTTLACISDTQYGICNLGGDILPDSSPLTCPTGMECSAAGTPTIPCVTKTTTRANTCPVGSASTPVCTTTGRFPVVGTLCKNYNLCTTLENGTLTYYTYTCPGTSVFDPNVHTCSTTYTCTDS